MSFPPPLPVVALVTDAPVAAEALHLSAQTLREFEIAVVEVPAPTGGISPEALAQLAATATTSGWRAVIVASADAVLPGAIADAVSLPVIRVPCAGGSKAGLELLQTTDGNLPASVDDRAPFATVAIGAAGAKNAALFVVSLLALDDEPLREAWEAFRAAQTDAVLQQPPPALG